MQDRLKRAWKFVEDKWYKPYYLGLYGSQNYNLDTPKSDFDFKCIILPTLEDLVNKEKPLSCVFDFEWWQIELKDIRNYVESAVKVNVNFIEILSTEHYLGAPEIRKFFTPLLSELWTQYLRGCLWMIMQKFHAMERPFESKKYEIETFGYDPKQLCHIVRLNLLMKRRLEWDYSFKHDTEEKDYLIRTKWWAHSLWLAREIAKLHIDNSERIVNDYKWEDKFDTKNEMIKWSRDLIIKNILWVKEL